MADNPNLTGEHALNAAPTDKTDKARWIAEFIDDLRRLRQDAGQPSLRKMSETAHYSRIALSGVLSGGCLPSLDLTLAFVRACGGDEDQWRERWQQANTRINPVPTVLPQPSVRRRWSRRRSVRPGSAFSEDDPLAAARAIGRAGGGPPGPRFRRVRGGPDSRIQGPFDDLRESWFRRLLRRIRGRG